MTQSGRTTETAHLWVLPGFAQRLSTDSNLVYCI